MGKTGRIGGIQRTKTHSLLAFARRTTVPENEPVERLLTVEEVAAWLRVEPAWVRAHANGSREPKLPSLKVGAFCRFRRQDIQRFLEELSKRAA
jgi:Helix-turn-helix domain